MIAAMSEEELRIAALETLAIELFAVLQPGQLLAMEDSIREGLARKGEPGDGSEEQTIRLHALQLIDDGRRRHDGVTGGILIPKPKS